jgi:hypothetical protein
MPLLLFPGGPASSGIDVANVINDILPALGANDFSDLDWCTQAELFQFADEAANRLAHRAGVWVNRYGLQTITAGTSVAPQPGDLVDAIHVSVDGASLRPVTALQLAALDAGWQGTAGTPQRFSMDAAPGSILLYPATTAATSTLATIYHQRQPTVQPGQSVLPIASPVQDYIGYSVLEQARRKESDQQMTDMADHFAQRVALYEQIFEHYWGANEGVD